MFFNLCLYIFFSSGKIHYTEIFDMLRNIDPPLGFGKKCPERLAYKKLIRMNMPMDFEGKVRKLFLFASTSAIQNLIYLHFSSCKHFHRVSKFEQAIKILPFAEKKNIFCIFISLHSHFAYVAMSTKSYGVKIGGFLYPNFMYCISSYSWRGNYSFLNS